MQMCKHTANNSGLETEMIIFFIPRWKITNTSTFAGMFPLQRKYFKKTVRNKVCSERDAQICLTRTHARPHAHTHARTHARTKNHNRIYAISSQVFYENIFPLGMTYQSNIIPELLCTFKYIICD